MSEKLPSKRQRNPHALLDESDLAKRARLEQPSFLDTSRLQEPAWLNPISSSNPSQRNSFSPFALSDAGSSRLFPLNDQPFGNEDAAILSDNESDQCCFGELLIDFLSPATLSEDLSHVPIELRFSNHVISLHVEGSGNYMGRIESKTIVDLVQNYLVTLVTTLECPPVKKKKSTDSFQTPKTLHIVIYGLRKDMNDIGDLLEDSELFLQHPTEYDTRLEYLNPQYLLRPGSTIPRADGATFQALSNQHSSDQAMEEKAKSEVHRVFDSASGPSNFTQVQPSPRLRTSLQEHQKKALAMMVEKDSGLLDNTTFPSLWDTVTTSNGRAEYRHVVTGRIEVHPAPSCGGILADDMGLGKTLSTLALISWFLDVMDNGSAPKTCRTTLIVAPNSTIPAWQEQIVRHVVPDQIRVVLFHGPMREKLAKSLIEYDVVLTTYGTLQSEWRSKKEGSPLFTHTWARVVLDEGQIYSLLICGIS
ncbi:hypothetical protein FNYG_05311 [Fusarium nygamai]|uniref:Helicase ATP-binding domain-containing protein n=1 Tax=Gibberella nygamai TaxID=42673 RepID=A0A2K0WG84_GIBNY|nr:hypothetical protein FNYG_05311 [Fusarium nygamai]